MPDMGDAFPSRYLKASDLNGRERRLTIHSVVKELVGSDMKHVLFFQGQEKGLVLNKTNNNILMRMYGRHSEEWAGKPCVIYPTEVEMKGDLVSAIRVRNTGSGDGTGVGDNRPLRPLEDREMNDEVPL